jgi:elongator complex protein 2
MPPTQIPASVALVALAAGQVALVVGAVDAKLHVWGGLEGADGRVGWEKAGTLTGHQDWVRALDWRPLEQGAGAGALVASGAQDGKIRVWKFEATEAAKPVAGRPVCGGTVGLRMDLAS